MALLNLELFLWPFTSSYYAFGIGSVLLVLYSCFVVLKKKRIVFSGIPIYIFTLYIGYCFISSILVFSSNWFTLPFLYILSGYLLLLSFINLDELIEDGFLNAIVSLSFLECLVCVLQFFGVVEPLNPYHEVTGTLINPNLTSMFITLSLPVVYLRVKEVRASNFFTIVICGFVIFSLFLLKCRTSFLGLGIGLGGLFFLEKIHPLIGQKIKIKSILGILSLVFLVLMSLYYLVFNFKVDSTSSRLFIWEMCVSMFYESPIFGKGFNSFAKQYNLFQANYFMENVNEFGNLFSSTVKTTYNDYLLNLVELGLTGLVLYLSFIISILVISLKSTKLSLRQKMAFIGVIIFASMSFTNSMQYMPSTYIVFIIYIGILIKGQKNISKDISGVKRYSVVFIAILILFLGFRTIASCVGGLKAKSAMEQIKKGEIDEAINSLRNWEQLMDFSYNYWVVYGIGYQHLNQNILATEKFEKASSLFSDYELYLNMSNSYLELNELAKAVHYGEIAMYMVPGKLKTKYHLMKVYFKAGYTEKTISIAKDILKHIPKGNSKDHILYKQRAKELLDFYEQQELKNYEKNY